jgi:hypothetical protein
MLIAWLDECLSADPTQPATSHEKPGILKVDGGLNDLHRELVNTSPKPIASLPGAHILLIGDFEKLAALDRVNRLISQLQRWQSIGCLNRIEESEACPHHSNTLGQ